MNELSILFAINNTANHSLEKTILNKYEEKYNKAFTYDKAFYLISIMKSLKEKHYDVLILSESLDTAFDISFIDKITDQHPELRVILRIDDRRRGTPFIKQIYSMACYDCIYQEDFKLDTLIDLIENPRNKKRAKEYYGLEDDSFENVDDTVVNSSTSLKEIPEDELEQVLISLSRATNESIKELFQIALKTYNFEQMTYLISIIRNNEKLINLLKESDCDIEPYFKALETPVNNKSRTKVVEKVVERVVEKPVERIVEKVVEKKVIEKEYIDREVEVVKEIYNTPSDYKKVVAVIGADRRVGTTTIIEMIAEKLNEDKRKVSIVDFSNNKNLFERHIFNEEEKTEPLKDLIKGLDKPVLINNKSLLYTSAPRMEEKIISSSEMNKVIDIVKIESDVVLIDMELSDLEKVYPLIDKILFVVTQDLTSTKYFTNKLDDILNNIYLGNFTSKVSFIVNKYLSSGKVMNNKELIECYLYKIEDYMNTDLNKELMENKFPIFKIDFNIDILSKSYKGDKYFTTEDEEVEGDIYKITSSIYPISQKINKKSKVKGLLGGLLKSKK